MWAEKIVFFDVRREIAGGPGTRLVTRVLIPLEDSTLAKFGRFGSCSR